MGGYSNPLTGSGWGGQAPNQNQMFQNPITAPTMNYPGPGSRTDVPNPGGYSNAQGANEINRNQAILNAQLQSMRNQLFPQWSNLMGQAGGVLSQFANQGSPYYKQKQAEAFTSGVNQNQQAMGQAKQQLGSQGYGGTPSGATAAMIGGMNQAGGQSLAEQYLQNLFNNENLQLQSATALGQMFNPAQLTTGSTGANVQAPNSFFQNFEQTTQGIKNLGQGAAGFAAAGA